MRSRLKSIWKENKGFTLLEVMLTTAIVAILTGIASAGIYGYMTSAYMNRVNETAKTVFLAAQNYLTEKKQLGLLETLNKEAESYGELLTADQLETILRGNSDADFDFDAYKDKYSLDSIRYVLLKEGDGNQGSSNLIQKIIDTYIGDTELLKHTFLLEYDIRTGVVRSVFYTEKAASFSYTGEEKDKSNVILRDSSSLREKRQGFYGVDSTALAKYDIDVFAPAKVKLMNGERLYVEWKETNFLSPEDRDQLGYIQNANDAFHDEELKEYLVYDLEVYRRKSEGDEMLFSIEGINSTLSSGKTLAAAEEKAASDGIVLAYDSYSNTYQLLLDCIDRSILTAYGMESPVSGADVQDQVLAEDMIYGKITAKIQNHGTLQGVSDVAYTNLQSANYAGGADSFTATGLEGDRVETGGNGNLFEDGSSKEYEKAFSITNARQLNNMRNALGSACFIQTGDIDWARPESDRAAWDQTFDPLIFAGTDAEGAVITGPGSLFKGTFTNGYNDATYAIYNLKIDKLSGTPEQNVGMFSQNNGVIDGLKLVNASIRGARYVGAVTGRNAGEIRHVTLENCVVEGSYYTGGITGRNFAGGILQNSVADVKVRGNIEEAVTSKIEIEEGDTARYGQYIGGVAGVNEGNVYGVETAGNTVTGLSFVGGLFGSNCSGSSRTVEGCTNRNQLKVLKEPGRAEEMEGFGGIAGINREESTIKECSNGAVVFLEEDSEKPDYIKNIGGIAGENLGILKDCESTLENAALLTEWTHKCAAALTEGILPEFSGVNVGGIAGLNGENAKISGCKTEILVAGNENVGGLAGVNRGIVKAAGSAWESVFGTGTSKSGGLVIAARQTAGGILGTNENPSLELEGFVNEANVISGSVAGGIVGCNGGSGSYTFAKTKEEAGYYSALFNPSFATIETGAKIKNCENSGFIYVRERYGGGITGINLGTIENAASKVDLEGNIFLKNIDSDYKKIARADCVGGIAGYNKGILSGISVDFSCAAIYADSFAGGITGLNNGSLKGYSNVKGDIYASGSFAGGFIGMNMSPDSLSNSFYNYGMTIKGSYFVGGIIGLNVSDGESAVTVKDAHTSLDEGNRGKITGAAYVGGILGYGTKKENGMPLEALFEGELRKLMDHAFDAYAPADSAASPGGASTVFSGCYNESAVYGDRYVGGILGYNSDDNRLIVTKSYNYGEIAILDSTKTADGNYYFIGGITGRNSLGGIIDQCNNDGSVISPSMYLGGICEVNEGYIQFCIIGKSRNYNDLGISGDNSVGGLVGLNSNYIVCCSTSKYAKITGGDNTGGLAGTNDENGIITGDTKKAVDMGDVSEAPLEESKKCVASGTVIGRNQKDSTKVTENTGGIVGLNQGTVEYASVEGSNIAGGKYVGGFIGNNMGTIQAEGHDAQLQEIKGLVNYAEMVAGDDEVGGIVGKHNAQIIRECKNFGIVKANAANGRAGGITGSVEENITIQNCINYGTVVSNYYQAGGITGNNKGSLANCTNYGSVTGAFSAGSEHAVGGITGVNEKNGSITDCASLDIADITLEEKEEVLAAPGKIPELLKTKNTVTTVYMGGGLIGYNKGTVSNKKYGGRVSISITLEGRTISSICYIGGVIGKAVSESTDTLKSYTYTGTITVESNAASQNQCIGGIISKLEKTMTLEDCIFAGSIKGYGNKGGNSVGVGGLAGASQGTILVYPSKDGIYTSNTEDSMVQGNVNVGGVAGYVGAGHTILIRKSGVQTLVSLEELSENRDGSEENDIYYTNLASVSGVNRVGGFYGRAFQTSGNQVMRIAYYQNGLEENSKAGNITPHTVSKGFAIGGIIGSDQGTGKGEIITYVRNYGIIGSQGEEYRSNADSVGGIIGKSNAGSSAEITKAYNYGTICCGVSNIGGIIGSTTYTGSSRLTVTDCQNYGKMELKAGYAGGIIGSTTGTIVQNVRNQGTITVDDNVSRIGGIIGSAGDNTKILESANQVRITLNRKGTADGIVGGIAGEMKGSTIIDSCVNKGEIKLSHVRVAGGITGQIAVTAGEVQRCTNEGSIEGGLEKIGGITGVILSAGSLNFQDNVNESKAVIYAKYQTGGIAGSIKGKAEEGKWKLEDCTNKAEIHVFLPTGSANNVVSQVGGTIGILKSNCTIVRFVNEGSLIVGTEAASIKEIHTVVDIGGIAGVVDKGEPDTGESSLYACTNSGGIRLENMNYKYTVENLGGVAGILKEGAQIDSSENKAALDVEAYLGTVTNLGGVTGYSEAGTKVLYCVNYENILGSIDMSKNVGGISGRTKGLVYSCKTGNLSKEVKRVQGNESVGGLAGYADSADCKISSIINKKRTGYEYSINSFQVKGNKRVGGLVGYQKGATLYTLINDYGAAVTLAGGNPNKESDRCAGGMVGKAVFDGDVPGVIANCYTYGNVAFESKAASACYLGGVTGYRRSNGEKVKTAAVSIKDSFYLYDEKDYPYVDGSKPGNITSEQVLAVGNEPYGVFVTDAEDQQYGEGLTEGEPSILTTKERFRWSKEAYIAMYQVLHKGEAVKDSDKWADKETVCKNIMHYYNLFRLAVPKTEQVVSVKAYDYLLPVKKLPGFCEAIEVRIYDGVLDDGVIEKEEVKPLISTGRIEVGMDYQLKNVPLKVESLQNYIGKPVKVTIQAFGVKEELADGAGELVYTGDSKLKVVQEFIIMPPLVTPEAVLLKQEGAKLTFQITNWDMYQKSAGQIYAAIQNNPELVKLEIYQKLLKGMDHFYIDDYYLVTEDGERKNGKETWIIGQDQVDQTEGTFQIDYSQKQDFDSKKSEYQYHDWDISAIASHSDSEAGDYWPVEAGYVRDTGNYRYTTSLEGSCKYQIEAETKLNPPRNLQAEYSGGIDWLNEDETPSYTIYFDKSTSPEEAVSHYEITITNPDNKKSYGYQYVPDKTEEETPVDPDSPDTSDFKWTLTKEILLGVKDGLDVDLSPDGSLKRLNFTIAAVPKEEAKYFRRSDDAQGVIALVKKEYQVDQEITITVENPSTPNVLTYHWTDSRAGVSGNNHYIVSYTIIKDGVESKSDPVHLRGDLEYTITLPEDLENGVIEFQIVRQGRKDGDTVKTLNSDTVAFRKTIGKLLDQVTSLKAEFSRVEEDMLYYNVTFQIPDTLTEENCRGFTVQAVDNGGTEAFSEVVTIPFDAVQPIEIGVPAAYMGRDFYVHIIALSKEDDSAHSERQLSNLITIPSERLKPSAVIGVNTEIDETACDLTKEDGYTIPADKWTERTYRFTWDEGEQEKIGNQHLKLMKDGEAIAEVKTQGRGAGYDWKLDLSAYAGKTLLFRICHESKDTSTILPSEAAVQEVYIPKIRLEPPELLGEKLTIIKNGELEIDDTAEIVEGDYKELTYELQWKNPDGQAGVDGVKITVVDETGKPVQFQVKMADGSDTVPAEEYEIRVSDTEGRIPETCILTGIDSKYAGKKLIVAVSYTVSDPDSIYGTYVPRTEEFILPKVKVQKL